MPSRLKICGSLIGLCLVVLATTSVVVRTEYVAGPYLETHIESWANRHDWSIQIGGMSPAGLGSIQFSDLRIRGQRGRIGTVARLEKLTIEPDWRRLLSGELTAGRIIIRRGDVTVLPASPSSTDDGPGQQTQRGTDEPVRERSVPADTGLSAGIPENLTVTAKQLRLRTALSPTQPGPTWHVESVTATIDALSDWRQTFSVQGFGASPRGTPFTLKTGAADTSGEPTVELTPLRPLVGTDLVAMARAQPLRVQSLSLCPACDRHLACAISIDWRGDMISADTRRSCLAARDGGVEWWSASIRVSRDGQPNSLHLREPSVTLAAGKSSITAETTLTDGSDGTLDITLIGRRDAERPLIGKFQTDGFDLELPLNWLELDRYMPRATVAGKLFAGWTPTGNQIRLKGRGELQETKFKHPFLGKRPVPVDRLRASWISHIQLDGGVINVPHMRVGLADSVPVDVTGYLADARPGWSFGARATARDVSAPRLHHRLPEILVEPASGTRLTGTFDSRIHVSGHTERPERLHLGVDIGGGVDVDPVHPEFDLPTLAAAGPPVPGAGIRRATDIPLEQWVSVSSMPEIIPEAITAAEDVHFFEHDGFAWRGLRNAMVHNLEVGRLERGGSTITQQVAKNLFLTRERTLTRKIHEMWLTWRLESRLSKERILELYVNIVEWGPGSVRGLRQASMHFFDRQPEELTVGQVTLLASILPAPGFYGELLDNGYLPSSRLEKVQHILQNLAYLDVISASEYDHIWSRARTGHPGGLDLTLCRDPNPPRREVPPGTPECEQVLET